MARLLSCCAVEVGVEFDPVTLQSVPIREDDECHGLRLTMAVSISMAPT
ncbi:hypothetical protein [Nocardia panacis]|nr:hypothetical protein [Nocardia panacis]